MSVTKLMSSKANVKQYSAADLPMQPKQAVIARMAPVESTANQIVINLPWYVDTINAQESFFLCIDGKILSIGASNDFTMTSVDVLGFSNQCTLNAPLVAGLNIQAWKLGAKKESEFAQDQRFVNIYDNLDKSLQGFVDQSQLMTATASGGSPSAGTFHSTIIGRSSMVDMRQDLRPRMGVERLMANTLVLSQTEYGPSNEPVYTAQNDLFNQMRFVGIWSSVTNSFGNYNIVGSGGGWVEITFYGTGLNIITYLDSSARDGRVSVDGGAESANIFAAFSDALTNRNYNPNIVINAAQGLALGVHTVKIRQASAFGFYCLGFDVLNDSVLVKTNPGIGYNQGKKITSAVQDATSYTSGVTGTRGGRTVVYQNSDGTIGRAFQAVNPSAGTLSGADHANEEVARVYHFREFGAGRSANDDFSTVLTGNARGFALEDGTTALTSTQANSETVNSTEMIFAGNTFFQTITFVGTGLDIIAGSSGARNTNISIDGGAALNIVTGAAAQIYTQKIVSGLPYGTHTVRFSGNGSACLSIAKFIVYQPKKPSIPAGTIELADYNVMADFIAPAAIGIDVVGQGVLRKFCQREVALSTTYLFDGIQPANFAGGFAVYTTTSGTVGRFTFVGTGVTLFGRREAGYANATIAIDGNSNFSGVTTSVQGWSFTPSTGALVTAGATAHGSSVSISGLPFGVHTITMTTTTAATFEWYALDVIGPIHSAKSDVYADNQNSLPIGSNAMLDTRKLTAIKEIVPQRKNIASAQSFGTTSTSSTNPVPAPQMSVTHTNTSGKIKISYSVNAQNSTGSLAVNCSMYVDGVQVGLLKYTQQQNGFIGMISDTIVVPVSPGVHKVDIYWWVNGASGILENRTMVVEEV